MILADVAESTHEHQDYTRQSIFGHSMGGHGAISLYLRNPTKYRSASGFSPALNPSLSVWGVKAFKGYLSGGIEEGKQYDSTELIAKASGNLNILIDYVRDPRSGEDVSRALTGLSYVGDRRPVLQG